jgi:hypothetical protein
MGFSNNLPTFFVILIKIKNSYNFINKFKFIKCFPIVNYNINSLYLNKIIK